MVAVLFDIIEFFIAVNMWSNGVHGYRGSMLLFICSIFLLLDFYYTLWVISLKLKLPPELTGPVTNALMGKGDKLIKYLKDKKS